MRTYLSDVDACCNTAASWLRGVAAHLEHQKRNLGFSLADIALEAFSACTDTSHSCLPDHPRWC